MSFDLFEKWIKRFSFVRAQQTSSSLDIITGFHLFDAEQHLFVLEGRKEDAIDTLYKQIPKPQGQSRIIFSYFTKSINIFFRCWNSLWFFRSF